MGKVFTLYDLTLLRYNKDISHGGTEEKAREPESRKGRRGDGKGSEGSGGESQKAGRRVSDCVRTQGGEREEGGIRSSFSFSSLRSPRLCGENFTVLRSIKGGRK